MEMFYVNGITHSIAYPLLQAQIPRMTKLDLSRNLLVSLPVCKSITHVCCYEWSLQDNFSLLKHVLELDLSKNQLTELPESFGELAHLQKLDLYGNKLSDLPLSFAGLERLRWLDLKNNPLNKELDKVAGTCVNEAECKECARNVSVFL